MLTLQKSSVSIVEVEQMRDILFMFFEEYKSKTCEEVASKMNIEFNRNDITGKMLFEINEPNVQDLIEDVTFNAKNCNYG